MGSCCIKKILIAPHPDPIVMRSLEINKTFKKYPTSIKIIPASPNQSSLIQDDSPSSPEIKLKATERVRVQQGTKNLLQQFKGPLTASQSLNSKNSKNLLLFRDNSSSTLKIPGHSQRNLNSSNSISSISSDTHNPTTFHRRRFSDMSLLNDLSKSSDSPINNKESAFKSIKKSKSLEGKKIINQYTFLELIGRGAFGKVFKVVDDKMNLAAAKVFNKRVLLTRWLGKKKTAMDSVKTEIEVMMKLDHPNIVKLIEVIDDESSKKLYLIMELAQSGTLNDLCPMSEELCKDRFKDLMKGVEYLHNVKSIVHRDLKPQNLLITKENSLKICDFGAAQLIQDSKDELCSSSGTFMFMPPEAHSSVNFRGKPADIWACGITLYYMLTKSSPYINKTYSALIEEIKTSTIKFPESISPTLQDLLRQMTEKDPFTRISAEQILTHPWLVY